MSAVPLWDHQEALGRTLSTAPRWLILSDFDGTLNELFLHPDDSRLPDPIRALLTGLALRASIGIITGRGLHDIVPRVGEAGWAYAGNHGLEIRGPGLEYMDPVAILGVDLLRSVTDAISRDVEGVPGVLIENKRLTASIHFRQVPGEWHPRVRGAVGDALGPHSAHFELFSGHAVLEIRPKAVGNKGTAARWLVERLGGPDIPVIFMGDDRTDEDAFRALPGAITVKVGPPAGTAARYFVDSPREVERFLRWLAVVGPGM